jgi:UV DNA damage endonuclease
VHISSPAAGWNAASPGPHHDYIDPADVPACWIGRRLTVEVEAKAKELAVHRLAADLVRLLPDGMAVNQKNDQHP